MRQQPSMTAQAVASNIIYLSQDPTFGTLVAPERVEAIRAMMKDVKGRFARAVRMSDSRFYRWYMPAIERAFMPGLGLHQSLRKRWIEVQTRTALNDGFRRFVALGAGFDPLFLILHREFPNAHFYEIDHPATQEPKRAALATSGGTGPNLTLLPVDFSQSTLADALAAAPGYDPSALTLFTAEGVLMYLTEAEVRALLQTMRAHSAAGSRFVGTLMEPDPVTGNITMRGGNRIVSRIVEISLKVIGEPLRWGISPRDLAPFLATEQFRLRETSTTCAVLERVMPDAPPATKLPGGEYLFAGESTG